MRIPVDPRLPTNNDIGALKTRLSEIFRAVANQINGISEGAISAHHQAATAAPATGTFKQGDFVKNSAPVEAGSVGSKYVVIGWTCVSGGSPGTWVQNRTLTGN